MIQVLPPNSQNKQISKPTQTNFHFQGVNRVQMMGSKGFVVCSWDMENQHQLHYKDRTGNTISSYKMKSPFAPLFEAISDHQLLILNFGMKESLVVWNLENGNKNEFQLSFNLTSYARMFVFPQTKLICLAQRRKNGHHIAYFQFHQNETIQLINQHSFSPPSPSNLIAVQIDHISKIAFLPKQMVPFTQQWTLYIYSGQKSHGHSSETEFRFLLKELKWKHEIGAPKGDSIHTRISDAWMVQPTILYLQFEVFQVELAKKIPKHQITHDFYWNIVDGGHRKSKIEICGVHRLQFTGNFRKYFTDAKVKNQITELFPIYFVNYETETIVGQKLTNMKELGSILPIASNTTLMSFDLLLKDHQMHIQTWDIPYEILTGYSVITAHFMTELIENCEEDFICYVGQLLKTNSQPVLSFQN